VSDLARSRRQRLLASLARGSVEIRTRGRSMRPLLEPGDRVRLERRAPRSGDVALVEIGERLVLHRLVRPQGETWWVRGEQASAGIGRVHRDQVVAIATERRRDAQEPPGWRPLEPTAARPARWFGWWRGADRSGDT